MYNSYLSKEFQFAEEGLDDFKRYKEREKEVLPTAAGTFGSVRIFTLDSDFDDMVLGLRVSAKRGQKIVVKKIGKYHDEDSLAKDLTRDDTTGDGSHFTNAQELYDWLKSVPKDDKARPDFEVNDYDSLLKYYEYMVGYTAKQNPIRLENKMRKEAELQQKCASFSPRVAPYVYGLNEVEEFENNSHFIAMEYMEESLKDCFKNKEETDSTSISDEFSCQLLALCVKLFQHGIVHNDMHKGNIMVNSIGRPYFIDFGLSKDNMNPYESFINLHKTGLCVPRSTLSDVYNWAKEKTRAGKWPEKNVDGLYALDDDFKFFDKLHIGFELLRKNDFTVSPVPIFKKKKKKTEDGNIFSRLLGLKL